MGLAVCAKEAAAAAAAGRVGEQWWWWCDNRGMGVLGFGPWLFFLARVRGHTRTSIPPCPLVVKPLRHPSRVRETPKVVVHVYRNGTNRRANSQKKYIGPLLPRMGNGGGGPTRGEHLQQRAAGSSESMVGVVWGAGGKDGDRSIQGTGPTRPRSDPSMDPFSPPLFAADRRLPHYIHRFLCTFLYRPWNLSFVCLGCLCVFVCVCGWCVKSGFLLGFSQSVG